MVRPSSGRSGERNSDSKKPHQETKRSSAVRKEQNKNASRIYRERRKQKLALLEQLLVKENNQAQRQEEEESTTPTTGKTAPAEQGVAQTIPSLSSASPAPSTYADLSFNSPWPVSTNDAVWGLSPAPHILDSSPLFLFGHHEAGDLGDSGNRAGGWPSPQPRDPSSAMTPSSLLSPLFSGPQEDAQPPSTSSQYRSSEAKEIATTTDDDASQQRQQDESLGHFLNQLMNLRVPDVKKIIYVQQNGLFAALMDNTLAIGITDRQLLFTDDATSPFNKDWAGSSRGSIQLSEVKSKFSAAPRDLQPVDSQITVEHHIYLDIIPFPSFRERALEALTCDPPLFDEDELCYDICNREGLVVWGSQGNDQGMDACRPWDMRSWEPKPWFLRKYHFLAGGWEDEMWRTARWWHTMRSERIVGP
ncbi:hypothetical protein VMCG_06239 [Cytospora schulzeri]|uniref:BZIP domain-containing protein n=1 Tax=Cytospora schulzeri TaxID=448051 RepID=A0A423W9F0_9PEZI|nr:hypothetical protein VMCG_06239 [Valsa malicola]